MKYYHKLLILLALMWGFVGIQRVVVSILMPAIQADMKFTYTDVGMVVSVTGLVWAFGALLWSALGDRLGRRPVIIACAALASVFSWTTGLVHSLGQMLLVRGGLGLFEGGPVAPAIATIAEEAPSRRRAMYQGIFLGSFLFVGMFLGPPLAVWLLEKFGSWRPVFFVISIPGLLISFLLAITMRESPTLAKAIKARKMGGQARVGEVHKQKVRLVDVLKYKNVILSTFNSIPVMAWLWIYTGFSSLFLTKVHHLGMQPVGVILAASGLGAFLGEMSLGAISDVLGRKPTVMLAAFLTACFGLAVALMPLGTPVGALTALFFFWGMFGAGTYPMYLATLPAESVPPEIAGTAVGLPCAVGELLGAALMPTIAGLLADKFSLFAPIWMASAAGIVVCLVSLFYVETAPRRLARMKDKPAPEDYLLRRFRPAKEMAAAPESF
jgi:MFS family permease